MEGEEGRRDCGPSTVLVFFVCGFLIWVLEFAAPFASSDSESESTVGTVVEGRAVGFEMTDSVTTDDPWMMGTLEVTAEDFLD